MNKFDNFIRNAEENLAYDKKDKLDKFIWKYGKWFLLIGMPFCKEMWWYERMAHPTLWLWLLVMFMYLFCAFFCFVDIYKIWKYKKNNL